ncbi:fructosamine kinase family protein [Streptomyces gardneri]|uniref:fructosamine kinase family protein n=1 Tax=Nocardia TaxID=1817 RepID=UPI00135AC91D|nr:MULTISPECIES: fructosamine kinase family protein [Nocardia]MBF6166831.1 fructosamine kinase family protein [Streptomyces gardneri]MBF6206662.1 fructosamine kinase family protein [Streptomyces gardneri]
MTPAAQLSALLGVSVRAVTDLGEGHAWTLHRAELADGRTIFVKASQQPTPVFAAEAAGLAWLRGTGRDRDGVSALLPEVLAADERTLVLPWLEESGPTPAAAERLGRELAALHAGRSELYGAPWDGWIARLPLPNTPTDGPWPRWYAEHRLAPYLAAAAGSLGAEGTRLLERVIERIDDLAGPDEPPARIHGDLWSGNILWTRQRAMLVDPAAHAGHRETDLAMLALFGAAHLDRILAAYHETHPLADGWRTRTPLHQLHPLLVHVVLFGAGYRARTVTAARAALAS